MRACGRCGHGNADHLPYCSRCGRRLPDGVAAGAPAWGGGTPGLEAGPTMADPPRGLGQGSNPGASVFAPTMALATPAVVAATAAAVAGPAVLTAPPHAAAPTRGALLRAVDAVRYVFVFVRGRLDAEQRRRRLIDEWEGARRLLESAFVDVGNTVLSEGVKAPELGNLLEALARTHAERDAAAKDLAASEKLQAAEDLRLGMQEAAAETEWKACESAARDVEDLLRKLDEQRRQAAQEQAASGQPGRNPRLARLDAEYGTLRERAAALRASTLGARARLDQARAGRRQAAAAMAAGITGQTRDRAEAEGRIRSLTVEVGQTAFRLKPPAPALKAAFTRVERLEETVKERERQLAVVARSASSYDHRKLAAGLGLLTGLCGVVGVTLWALLR